VSSRLLRRACALVLAGATLLGGIEASGSPRGDVSEPSVSAARLRLTLTTTSSWTELALRPGRVVASRVVSHAGRGRVEVTDRGVALTHVLGRASVWLDVVLAAPPGASEFAVTVDKGFLGDTDAQISNSNGVPYDVVDVHNDRHDATDARGRVATTVPRDRLLGAVPLFLPKADYRRLVLAAYYPWFSDYENPSLADRPRRPRSVWDAAGVRSMTEQAQAAGVNGFAVSWHGSDRDGVGMDLVRKAAERTGQLFTAYLEASSAQTSGLARSRAFVVRQWLLQALAYRSSPAFLTAPDGVPVVFVYGMASLTPDQWQDVLVKVAGRAGIKVHLVGDAVDPAYLPVEWGLHRYTALSSAHRLAARSTRTALLARAQATLDPAVSPLLYAGTVSPGFNDRRLRGDTNPVVPRRSDGSRYAATWRAALTGDPDWVFVSTWNEWFENTQIEPGLATGRRALRQTTRRTTAWRR
jgi:hypothetical protein